MTQEDEDAKTLKLLEDVIRRVVRQELERAQVPCIWCRKVYTPVPAPGVVGPIEPVPWWQGPMVVSSP